MENNGINRDELKRLLNISGAEFTSLMATFDLDHNTDFFNKRIVGTMISFLNKSGKSIEVDLENINFSITPTVRKSLIEIMNERKAKKSNNFTNNMVIGTIEPDNTIELREHQQEAVSNTLELLQDEDRAQIISACGTGKTLMAKDIIEKYIGSFKNSFSVIFFPSLSLIAQTYKAWKPYIKFDSHAKSLIICGDDDIVSDGELRIEKDELPFSVDTSLDSVVEFLQDETLEHKLCYFV